MTRKSTRFRELLARPQLLICPGAYDALSFRIVEECGFEAGHHGGYNTSASMLGMPDVGLWSATEAIASASYQAQAVDIPILADIDDGFGDLPNVDRVGRALIRAGLAGVYMEDQVFPKSCPRLGTNDVVPVGTMVDKLRTLLRAREEEGDPDFLVVARTHSSRTHGLDEAIRRGQAYIEAGADGLYFDAPYDNDAYAFLERLGRELGPHTNLIAPMLETVGRPLIDTRELEEMGFRIAFYSLTAIMAASAAVKTALTELREKGTTRAITDTLMPMDEISRIAGHSRALALADPKGHGPS